MKAFPASQRLTGIVFAILALILFSLPYSGLVLQLVRHGFEVGGYPLSTMASHILGGWKEILLLVGLLVVVVRSAIERRLPFSLTRLDLGLLGFMAVGGVVGGVLAGDSMVTGFRYDFSPFLYYFLARSLVLSRQQILVLLRNLVIFSLPVVALALLQALVLPATALSGLGYPALVPVAGLLRATGGFSSPSFLALYLAQVCLLLLFCGNIWFSAWVSRGLLAVCFLALLLTFSPGPLLGLVGTLVILGIILLIQKYQPQVVLKAGGGLLAGMALLGVVGYSFMAIRLELPSTPEARPTFVQRFLQRDVPANEKVTRSEVLAQVVAKPAGSGLGTSGIAVSPAKGQPASPHSWYLLIGKELGWLGLVLVLGLIALVCVAFRRLFDALHDRSDLRLVGYLITGFLATLLGATLLSSWLDAANITWWIVFGLFLSDYLASFPGDSALFPSQRRAESGKTTAAL